MLGTGGVGRKCTAPDGGVGVGSAVVAERERTAGRVVGACSVEKQRILTDGRVVAASGVTSQRSSSNSRVNTTANNIRWRR